MSRARTILPISLLEVSLLKNSLSRLCGFMDCRFYSLRILNGKSRVTIMRRKTAQRDATEPDILRRYSSLNKLLRITARCQEFIHRMRYRVNSKTAEGPAKITELTLVHLDTTFKFWVIYVQSLYFRDELQLLSKDQPIPPKSPLIRLNPFIDDFGALRVGGGLRHSLFYPDEKNPMMLPRESYLT